MAVADSWRWVSAAVLVGCSAGEAVSSAEDGGTGEDVSTGDDGGTVTTGADDGIPDPSTSGVSEGTHDSASGVSDGNGTTGGLGATLTVTLGAGPSVGGVQTSDGWALSYSRFVVSAGDTEVLGDGGSYSGGRAVVVDLKEMASVELDEVEVAPGNYGVHVRIASHEGAEVLADPEVVALMAKVGAALHVEGVLENHKGVSCTPGAPDACVPATSVGFRWSLVGTATPCVGATATRGAPSVATVRIGGDAWLLRGFTLVDREGERRGQWIADADLDHDGETTLEELKSIKAADLFGADYDLVTNAPLEVVTAYDYLIAHYQQMGAFCFL